MTKMKDLSPGSNATLEGEIIEKEEAREVITKFGKKTRVASAKLKCEDGEIKMTLWEDDVDKVKEGDKIKIEDGWVTEFRGELQISTGKNGKISVK
ncbi:DNA-binding protein [Candidatus Micrarchaeota archaeon]|jgi:replication factor A1|nr:DNA-binding protein [Candidatus Micrarchaeota archaeon]